MIQRTRSKEVDTKGYIEERRKKKRECKTKREVWTERLLRKREGNRRKELSVRKKRKVFV